MSRKQFKTETKIKYVNLILKNGFEYALISFICEFEDKYKGYLNFKGARRKNKLPTIQGSSRLKSWLNKYNIGGMKNLESKTGKVKKPNSGRRKKVSINDLNEHDRAFYQEIMEELLQERGISPRDIQEKLKKKKDKDNKKFTNHKMICEILNVNRTTIYQDYIPKIKREILNVQRLWVPGLIEFMCIKIIESDYTIGRTKLFKHYCNIVINPVSSYVFRVHFDSMEYKSKAYVRKNSGKPKEIKSKKTWTKDYLEQNFKSDYPGEVFHADIEYLYFENSWWYLHAILETYANQVVAWSLSKDRTANSTIALFDEAVKKMGDAPRIFHSDYGVEYANYKFKNHLKANGTIQSMSPKGSPLSNRPSEYWFAQIQRVKLDFYEYRTWKYSRVYILINDYVQWYNIGRPQSNLKYKTPQEVLTSYGACV